MLMRLIHLAPTETATRLDVLAEPFRNILSVKPKENAVKQEIERMLEESRDVIRTSLVLAKAWPDESNEVSRPWGNYFDWVKRDFGVMVKQAEEEAKEKERW